MYVFIRLPANPSASPNILKYPSVIIHQNYVIQSRYSLFSCGSSMWDIYVLFLETIKVFENKWILEATSQSKISDVFLLFTVERNVRN